MSIQDNIYNMEGEQMKIDDTEAQDRERVRKDLQKMLDNIKEQQTILEQERKATEELLHQLEEELD